MKKAIACILALLMVLSVVPFAFAEDETNNSTSGDEVDAPDSGDAEPELISAEPEDTGAENETEIEVEVEDETENETSEEEAALELPQEVIEEAGVTPDSPLWGLERAMERISLALTFGKSAKAKKGLAHAQERLMEVQAMIAQKKLDKAADAQEAHDETMAEVEENISELGDGDAVGELEDEVELEQALNQHRTIVQQTAMLKTKFKGLSAEQSSAINAIMAGLENSTGKAEIEVKAQQSKTKIKLKAKEGLTDDQIAGITAQIQEAVAAGKEAKVVLPGKTAAKTKAKVSGESSDEDGLEVEAESEDISDDSVKGKSEKASKAKTK